MEIRAHNLTRVRIEKNDRRDAPITLTLARGTTDLGACRAFLTLDQASELAAAMANLIDARKRG